jgi:hypothetical protein
MERLRFAHVVQCGLFYEMVGEQSYRLRTS